MSASLRSVDGQDETTILREIQSALRDLRFGAVRSKFQLADSDLLNHRVQIVEGVLAPECVEMLRDFFEGKRRSC